MCCVKRGACIKWMKEVVCATHTATYKDRLLTIESSARASSHKAVRQGGRCVCVCVCVKRGAHRTVKTPGHGAQRAHLLVSASAIHSGVGGLIRSCHGHSSIRAPARPVRSACLALPCAQRTRTASKGCTQAS